MVSKVAVMALVAVLAVPILLGYALNLSEVAITDYTVQDDEINVTQLLQNSTAYTKARGDSYKLNFNAGSTGLDHPMQPIWYVNKSTIRSSFYAAQIKGTASVPSFPGLDNFYFNSVVFTGSTNTDYVDARVILRDNTQFDYTKVTSTYFDGVTKQLKLYYNLGTTSILIDDPTYLLFYKINDYSGTWYRSWQSYDSDDTPYWVDISSGFYYDCKSTPSGWAFYLPAGTSKLTMTINLDSVTDANAKINFGYGYLGNGSNLVKQTVNGEVKWIFQSKNELRNQEIYYDPSRSDNTYQLTISTHTGQAGYGADLLYTDYDLKYVGGWPTIIGNANYFQSYKYEEFHSLDYPPADRLYIVDKYNTMLKSPIMRLDNAEFNSMQYPIIKDKTYDPSSIRSNPSTKITNPYLFGSSVTFAGNTYTVDKSGNMQLGTHKTSMNGIIFDSVPIPGGYENRINGNVVNISADPATITFNGQWDFSIATSSQDTTTYTKTQWIPGEFAWDGIDTNFLMVGLITCLGVFVGLGIYLRKTKSSMWPLLIVCGCAAGLFICMI